MSDLRVETIKHRDGTNTADINGVVPSVSNSIGRNKIINGKMVISQRGTSFANPVNGTYTLDRWYQGYATSAICTVAQSTAIPSTEFTNSMSVTVTTADTAIAADDYYSIPQRIEGYNITDLIGNTFTLSFWVRSSKAGVYSVAFKNGGSTKSRVAEYTINQADTWEKKTITISGGLDPTATWGKTTGLGLFVGWALACGSTYAATPGSWVDGNFLGSVNQVNALDTVNNVFLLTGVQLERGEVATPFEHLNIGHELALCQRYYWRGMPVAAANFGAYAANSYWTIPVQFPVTMRVVPTLTQNLTGMSFGALSSTPTWNQPTTHGGRWLFNSTEANANTNFSAGSSAYLEASAEL